MSEPKLPDARLPTDTPPGKCPVMHSVPSNATGADRKSVV